MSAKISELSELPGGVIAEGDLIEVVRGGGNFKFPAAGLAGSAAGLIPIKTVAGTSYTLELADAGKYIRMTSVDSKIITCPAHTDVAIEPGMFWEFHLTELGAESASVQGAAGVVAQIPVQGSANILGRGTARVICVDVNVFEMWGDFRVE